MIITFCGHSDFNMAQKYEPIVMSLFEKLLQNAQIEFYLGGYGQFDNFAFSCAKKIKQLHPVVSLTFVSPYLEVKCSSNEYDNIMYPELESIPRKYAILYRNRYMIEKADFVLAYVHRNYGGAYRSFTYAKWLKKKIINLAEL